jgi:hypothetical protein
VIQEESILSGVPAGFQEMPKDRRGLSERGSQHPLDPSWIPSHSSTVRLRHVAGP